MLYASVIRTAYMPALEPCSQTTLQNQPCLLAIALQDADISREVMEIPSPVVKRESCVHAKDAPLLHSRYLCPHASGLPIQQQQSCFLGCLHGHNSQINLAFQVLSMGCHGAM